MAAIVLAVLSKQGFEPELIRRNDFELYVSFEKIRFIHFTPAYTSKIVKFVIFHKYFM